MRTLSATAACLLLLGCGPTATVYYRTSPRRIEVSKQISSPSLYGLAVRADVDAVDVRLKRANRVKLQRVLHYNSAAIIYAHSGNVITEVRELMAGLAVAMLPASWGYMSRNFVLEQPSTPERKVVRRHGFLLALLDPTTSVLANNVRIEPVVTQQIFSNAPIVREYEIRVPAPNVVVAFRVLDAARNELARGSATTDPYGELQIRGPLEHAVAVELSTAGTVIVVPIRSSATPESVAPAEPADMPHTLVRPVLPNNGWAKREGRRLPRLTLMLDVAHLLSSDHMLLGEFRFHRKISAGLLLWQESISGDLPDDGTGTQFIEVGGCLRFYVVGDVRTGIHLGFSALTGFRNDDFLLNPLHLVSYGLMLGYKRTFASGLTFELAIGPRYLTISESIAPQDRVSMWRPLSHVNFGWSF